MASRKRIFSAVFPSFSKDSAPTPTSTPQLGSALFGGESFGFPESSPEHDAASERIKQERAWHTATAFLILPNAPIPVVDATQDLSYLQGRWIKQCPPDVSAAFAYLDSHHLNVPRTTTKTAEDLIDWYTQEVGRHYIHFQLPRVLEVLADVAEPELLVRLLDVLQISQAVYSYPLSQYVVPKLADSGQYEFSKFEEGYEAMIAKSISETKFSTYLSHFLKRRGAVVLGLERPTELDYGDSMMDDDEALISEARNQTLRIMRDVDKVGLGGPQAQRLFAEVMSGLLTAHVDSTYAGQWSSPSTIPEQLRDWVENHFARFVVEVLACLEQKGKSTADRTTQVSITDLDNWKQRAICDLGALRLRELFEIVVDWDNDTKGAIEDLKQYITTTTTRSHLTTSFSTVISQRLLQPGASTTEILQVYICIIRSFAILDPRGVLLDRLARPIRRYLRDRDDTAKIIVGGLLADVTDDPNAADVLIELAVELNKVGEIAGADEDDGELDWDDMSWIPDPIDAGPEYKKSKSHDVIGTLISLFDTKDIFVKEFQNILGERLLNPNLNIDKEVRVLELLKIRFGDPPLQACEVMLKDILDSTRTDALIHRKEASDSSPTAQFVHAQILSRLFWPALNADTFTIPQVISDLQNSYAIAFEAIKPTRKLTWLPALGLVTVELHLQDRTIVEDVHTWQATVIYAFQEDPFPTGAAFPCTKTVDQLVTDLAMDESLVLNALTFWVGKLVLHFSPSSNTYTVLETLSTADLQLDSHTETANAAAAAASAAAASTAAAVRSADDIAAEKMEEFWPYIVGMLTNQGGMPASKIGMMLKFAVPRGFPFGAEELKGYLRGKVEEGELEMAGGKYVVVKGP